MQQEESESLTLVSPEVVYQQDKAVIDVQIATAKQYPRNIKRAVETAIAIATMDIETAQSCTYSVPRGNKPITGKSVHLARILFQVWTNLRAESKVIAIDAKEITSEGVCFDLESNTALKAQVKRSIMGKMGRYSDDMITVTGNAANSIAFRNAVFAVIPKSVVDKVYNAAMKTIVGDVSDEIKLIGRRKQVFDGLKDTFNVSEKEVLASIGKAALTHVTADDLIVLIGIGTAIRDGDTTVEQAFKGVKNKEEISLDMLNEMLKNKMGLINSVELKTAKRIIENNEVASFSKLYKMLI
jgi:hypothetical protein